MAGEPTGLIFKPTMYMCSNHTPADHAFAGFNEVPTCLPFLEQWALIITAELFTVCFHIWSVLTAL
jgi:hypothetical protein